MGRGRFSQQVSVFIFLLSLSVAAHLYADEEASSPEEDSESAHKQTSSAPDESELYKFVTHSLSDDRKQSLSKALNEMRTDWDSKKTDDEKRILVKTVVDNIQDLGVGLLESTGGDWLGFGPEDKSLLEAVVQYAAKEKAKQEAKRDSEKKNSETAAHPETVPNGSPGIAIPISKPAVPIPTQIDSKFKSVLATMDRDLKEKVPTTFDSKNPPKENPLYKKFEELAAIYAEAYADQRANGQSGTVRHPGLLNSATELARSMSPNKLDERSLSWGAFNNDKGGRIPEQMWESALAAALTKQGQKELEDKGVDSKSIQAKILARKASEIQASQIFGNSGGQHESTPAGALVQNSFRALQQMAKAQSGAAATEEWKTSVKDVVKSTDQYLSVGGSAAFDQMAKWGLSYGIQTMKEIASDPKALAASGLTAAEVQKRTDQLQEKLFSALTTMASGSGTDGNSNNHLFLIGRAAMELRPEQQKQVMEKLVSGIQRSHKTVGRQLSAQGALKEPLPYDTGLFNSPYGPSTNSTYRGGAGANVPITQAQFLANPSRSTAADSLAAIDNFLLYSGSYRAEKIRDETHGADGLAPYYMDSAVEAATRSLGQLDAYLKDHPDQEMADRVSKTAHSLRQVLESTWEPEQGSFTVMGGNSFRRLGPQTGYALSEPSYLRLRAMEHAEETPSSVPEQPLQLAQAEPPTEKPASVVVSEPPKEDENLVKVLRTGRLNVASPKNVKSELESLRTAAAGDKAALEREFGNLARRTLSVPVEVRTEIAKQLAGIQKAGGDEAIDLLRFAYGDHSVKINDEKKQILEQQLSAASERATEWNKNLRALFHDDGTIEINQETRQWIQQQRKEVGEERLLRWAADLGGQSAEQTLQAFLYDRPEIVISAKDSHSLPTQKQSGANSPKFELRAGDIVSVGSQPSVKALRKTFSTLEAQGTLFDVRVTTKPDTSALPPLLRGAIVLNEIFQPPRKFVWNGEEFEADKPVQEKLLAGIYGMATPKAPKREAPRAPASVPKEASELNLNKAIQSGVIPDGVSIQTVEDRLTADGWTAKRCNGDKCTYEKGLVSVIVDKSSRRLEKPLAGGIVAKADFALGGAAPETPTQEVSVENRLINADVVIQSGKDCPGCRVEMSSRYGFRFSSAQDVSNEMDLQRQGWEIESTPAGKIFRHSSIEGKRVEIRLKQSYGKSTGDSRFDADLALEELGFQKEDFIDQYGRRNWHWRRGNQVSGGGYPNFLHDLRAKK